MKRWILMFSALALAGVFPLFAQGNFPAIYFDSQSKDFGKVVEGQTLKHIFKFTNKGRAALEIAKVEPG